MRPRNSDLYGCPTDGGAIVLDLNTEKYFSIQRPDAAPQDDVAYLGTLGIKVHSHLIDVDLLKPIRIGPRVEFDVMPYYGAMLRATISVAITTRLFGASAAIRRLSALKGRAGNALMQSSSSALPGAIQAFRHLRPFLYTARDHCLGDALVLANYLLHLRHDVQFVVGVKARPFEAHAWAQIGSHVIEDFVEQVQLFTPILVV